MNSSTRDLVENNYDKLAHLGAPHTSIRVAVLEELRNNGSLSERELRDIFVEGTEEGKGWEFEVSKPTLYRQFEENPENSTGDTLSLVENGWVKDVSEIRGAEARYEITPKGRLIHDEMRSLFGLFDLMDDIPSELEPFLEVVTKADVEMDRRVLKELTDAEIYPTTPTNLFGVYPEYIDFISDVDLIRGITWVWSQLFLDSYYTFLVEEDKDVEFILTSEVAETVVESHTEEWREMLETGNLTVFECDIFPFGITIVENGVAWGYFEPEKGAHEYELISESETVREWAIGVFKEYKQKGRDVTQEQLEKTRDG